MKPGTLRWKRIAALSACLPLVVGALLAWQLLSRDAGHVEETAHVVDTAPLDMADARTREALLWHLRETNTSGLPPFANACRDDMEMYRLTGDPGLSDLRFRVINVRRSGSGVEIIVFGPRDSVDASGDFWQPVARMKVGEETLLPVREALDEALAARTPPVIKDRYIDVPRTTLETCRRGRYHYFSRAWNERAPDDMAGTRFAGLARSILRLAHGGQATASE